MPDAARVAPLEQEFDERDLVTPFARSQDGNSFTNKHDDSKTMYIYSDDESDSPLSPAPRVDRELAVENVSEIASQYSDDDDPSQQTTPKVYPSTIHLASQSDSTMVQINSRNWRDWSKRESLLDNPKVSSARLDPLQSGSSPLSFRRASHLSAESSGRLTGGMYTSGSNLPAVASAPLLPLLPPLPPSTSTPIRQRRPQEEIEIVEADKEEAGGGKKEKEKDDGGGGVDDVKDVSFDSTESFHQLIVDFDDLHHTTKQTLKNMKRKRSSSLILIQTRYDSTKHWPWFCITTVVVNYLLFAAAMRHNDCPGRSSACVGDRLLGRFAFESTSINPLYGPRTRTLQHMGAKDASLLLSGEVWRVVSPGFLHAGALHLLPNMLALLLYGGRLERAFGPTRLAALWITTSVFAMVCSSVLLPSTVTVGASGAVCGLFGASIAELIHNWHMYESSGVHLGLLVIGVGLEVAVGLAPFIDNVAHLSGILMGLLMGFFLFARDRFYEEQAISGPQAGLLLRRKLPLQRWQWWLIFSSVPTAAVLYFLALAALLTKADVRVVCPRCHALNCVDTWLWDCNQETVS